MVTQFFAQAALVTVGGILALLGGGFAYVRSRETPAGKPPRPVVPRAVQLTLVSAGVSLVGLAVAAIVLGAAGMLVAVLGILGEVTL